VNTFGRIFRVSMFGESHGEAVGVLLDGVPPGIVIGSEDFRLDLERRRGGLSPGTTTRKEADVPQFVSGVFEQRSTGAPLLIRFPNADVDSRSYAKHVDTPRPGHADLVARHRFAGFADPRGGGHFSGRLTVGIVAAGVVAKKILGEARVTAKLVSVGGRSDIAACVEEALAAGDSVGGLVECQVEGLPVGLGEPFWDSVEALLSHALFSIPAVKGVEFGAGFALAGMRGSVANDPLLDAHGRSSSNHSGGVTGGLTNGNPLVFRVAIKPTSSIKRAQQSVRLSTNEVTEVTVEGRHDACIALRVPVIVEAMTALVLADLLMLQNAAAGDSGAE